MARMPVSPWSIVSLRPATGLDTRSRPADITPGWFRWKENLSVSQDGKLGRRDGFGRAFSDLIYDNAGVLLSAPGTHSGAVYHNPDLHHQGQTRFAPTLLFESTDNIGVRRLFAGTQNSVFLLNESTAYWNTIISGKGSTGAYWQAAELQNVVVLTNDVDNVQAYSIDSNTVSEIPELKNTVKITKARVVVQFNGFILVMNVVADGKRQRSRIQWCDLNLPMAWDPGTVDTLANFQDLDYGDEILAAAPLLGSLYILTRRSIWRCAIGGTPGPFTFTRVYNEPKNQIGCIVYPRTLVSDGSNLYYGSRDAIYNYNPYIAAPERQDWLFKASGVIYEKNDTKMLGINCSAPVADYRPSTKELWFSWPSGTRTYNNWTLVASTEFKTADVVDAGFTAIANYRRTPSSGVCQEVQDLLAVSSVDWAIKSIGSVFYREYVSLDASGDIAIDLPLNSPDAVYVQSGYDSVMRGLIPTGYFDREKVIRLLAIDSDIVEDLEPCVLKLRLGNTFDIQDPNDIDDTCSVIWRNHPNILLKCPADSKISVMKSKNQRPGIGIHWPLYEVGRYLYFEITISNSDGTPAIGGDVRFAKFDFDVLAKPKV